MLQVHEKVVFEGTQTTTEERKALHAGGFVHVTGLVVTTLTGQKYRIGDHLKQNELGCWGYNNGIFAIVTLGGEVWIADPGSDSEVLSKEWMLLKLTPNDRGAFVPLSNGDEVDCRNLLRRLVDPNCGLEIKK